jgi:hypothetical protein
MAQADKKHFGKGTQGKGSGAGAMPEADGTTVGDNQVLSNRDKKQHSKERGQDGNAIKTEQQQDHAAIAGPRKLRHANFKNRRYPPGRGFGDSSEVVLRQSRH